jgi:hypothetical protein
VSFNEFILACTVTDSEQGDFVKSARRLVRAKKMPRITRWRELECFILGAGGCPHVVEAARQTWVEFEHQRARDRLLYRL